MAIYSLTISTMLLLQLLITGGEKQKAVDSLFATYLICVPSKGEKSSLKQLETILGALQKSETASKKVSCRVNQANDSVFKKAVYLCHRQNNGHYNFKSKNSPNMWLLKEGLLKGVSRSIKYAIVTLFLPTESSV